MTVDPILQHLYTSQVLEFKNGGIFTLTQDAEKNDTSITGNLTVSDVADNEESWLEDNGGTVIASNHNNVGRWKRRVGDYVDIRWFGAVADGDREDRTGTDNTDEIIAAIKSRYRVFIPPTEKAFLVDLTSGSNAITEDLINVHLFGAGKSSQILCINGSTDSSKIPALFAPNVVDGLTVENILFDGACERDNTGHLGAAYIFHFIPQADGDCKNILFTNCFFTRVWVTPIQTKKSTSPFFTENIRVEQCVFTKTGKHGIGLNAWRHGTISDCVFISMGTPTFDENLGTPGGMGFDISRDCKKITVNNCIIRDAGTAFKTEEHYSDNLVAEDITISNILAYDLFEGGAAFDEFAARLAGHRIKVNNINIHGGPLLGMQIWGTDVNITNSRIEVTGSLPAVKILSPAGGKINISETEVITSSSVGILVDQSLDALTINNVRFDVFNICVDILGNRVLKNLIVSECTGEFQSIFVYFRSGSEAQKCSIINNSVRCVGSGSDWMISMIGLTKATRIIGNIIDTDGSKSGGGAIVFPTDGETNGNDYNFITDNLASSAFPNGPYQIGSARVGSNSVTRDNISFTL